MPREVANTPQQAEQEEAPAAPANPFAQKPGEEPKSVVWVVGLISFLFLLGLKDFFLDAEENHCAMTYMYEYPAYVPLALDAVVEKRFPKYGLYAYGEGATAKAAEDGVFNGVPVLFIPGNSGSHKQVRSLASVALRKAMEKEFSAPSEGLHFDYFAVDFDEEFSALYGGSLVDQTEYVAVCVEKILGMYKGEQKSVVLVGHSLGGMVGKALFMQPEFDAKQVSILLTLATPHEPVATFDHAIRRFYDNVNTHWNASRSDDLKHVTFVTVGGGERDIQVRSGLTHSPFADVSVVSTDIPGVWVSADHRCIVWCKQIVLTLNRALFDSLDFETRRISTDVARRNDVFKYHLLSRTGGKRYLPAAEMHPVKTKFDRNGFWADVLKRQYSFAREHVSSNSYLMVKVISDPKHKMLTVDASNMDADNWIYGCVANVVHKNTRICGEGDNLSGDSAIIPSNGKRKTLTVDLHKLGDDKGYSHVIIAVPKGAEHVKVHLDVYNDKDRVVSYGTPRWISFWSPGVVVKKTLAGAVFYNVTLEDLDETWQAYDLHIKPAGPCEDPNHFGLARFITPWARDATQKLITHNETTTLVSRLQSPKPAGTTLKSGYALYLNPSCTYKIELQSNLGKMFGQITRYYLPLLPPLITAVILLTLAMQIRELTKEKVKKPPAEGEENQEEEEEEDETTPKPKYCPSFLAVVTKQVSPMSVVLPSKFLGFILGHALLSNFTPLTDYQRITTAGIDFGMLYIIAFFISIGFSTLISAAAWGTVIVFGNAASKIVTRFVGGFVPNEVVADLAVSGINRFPFLLSGVLLALAVATCGSVAVCLGTFLYFVHLFDLYKDYMQNLIKDRLLGSDDRKALETARKAQLSQINFQFTLALLWAIAALLNLPSLMAYARNIPHGIHTLSPDPSLWPAIVLSISLAATWDADPAAAATASPTKAATLGRMSFGLQGLCLLIALYGSFSMYRVNLFLMAAFGLISGQMVLLNWSKVEQEEVESTSSSEASTPVHAPSSGGDDSKTAKKSAQEKKTD